MKRNLLFILIINLSVRALSQSTASSTLGKPSTVTQSYLNLQEVERSSEKQNLERLPIKIERTISFTTDEASHTDVDISPDGTNILFSFLGDIYTMPSFGGIAKQLTRGLALKRCPVWSPNGKLIAYESDATGIIQLHIVDTTGSFHKVFGEDRPFRYYLNPIWLPDSKQVIVENDVYHLTGIESTLPVKIKAVLGFSTDGKFMYYLENKSKDSTAIIQWDKNNGKSSTLKVLNKNYDHFYNSKISPDARWFTYIKEKTVGSFDSLMAIDLANGRLKFLAEIQSKFTPSFSARTQQHYSISSNSKYLVIGYEGKIHRIDIESGKNQIIPFTAKVNVDLGRLNYNTFPVSLDSFDVKYLRSANRSPDRKSLVFSALNKIYVMNLPHGKPHVLVKQDINQFQPVYSPDGKWLVYVSWEDKMGGHIWIVPSHGGIPKQITTVAGLYQHPSWSPDAQQIVVAKGPSKLGNRNDPGKGQIQIISIKDKNVKIIADTVPLFNHPVFSADGKQLIYKPNQLNGDDKTWPRLVSKDILNNEVKVLALALRGLESIVPMRQIGLSPDRRYIVFTYNEDLYLSPMANVDNNHLIINETSPVTMIRFARGSIDPVWEQDGKSLGWLNCNRYCSIDPDKIIEAAERCSLNKTLEGLPQTKIIDVIIEPDESVSIQIKAPRLYQNGTIVLKNARIIPMHDNKIIENGTLVIRNGRIIDVGETGKINIPKEAKVFDFKGKTIIPGFIDMHSHMYEAVPPDIFLQQSWQRLVNLIYGVTTIRDPSGSFDTFGYSELVETGQMIGPRLFTVGNAVRSHYNITSLQEAKIAVNNRTKMGAVAIKQYAQLTRLQRQLLLLACEEEGVNMTNEGEKIPFYFIGMIKDGTAGIEHNPVWGNVYKDIMTLVTQSGTYLTPTLQVCYGKENGKYYFRKLYGNDFINNNADFIPELNKQYLLREINRDKIDSGFLEQSRIDEAIKKAGGRIVLGSHGEDQGIGAHYELWALQMAGLTNMEALQTGTITAAEALGVQKDLGSIEVGKIADLIILDRNPLEDIHNSTSIKCVMKSGVLYDRESVKKIQ